MPGPLVKSDYITLLPVTKGIDIDNLTTYVYPHAQRQTTCVTCSRLGACQQKNRVSSGVERQKNIQHKSTKFLNVIQLHDLEASVGRSAVINDETKSTMLNLSQLAHSNLQDDCAHSYHLPVSLSLSVRMR